MFRRVDNRCQCCSGVSKTTCRPDIAARWNQRHRSRDQVWRPKN